MKTSRIVLAAIALAALAATGFSTAKSKSAAPAAKDCCVENGDCCKPAAGCCNK
jgi:hypothetical protein